MGGNFFKAAIALGVIAGIMGFTNPPRTLHRIRLRKTSRSCRQNRLRES
ncbi:MAG UNVERIFIED_CONTAM: hypothetical protein LVR29_31620 [Microcystis novacekii LVE1205-3]|jgi:hypothetical protein